MKKTLLLIGIILIGLSSVRAEEQVYQMQDFTSGIHSKNDPLLIPDGSTPDSQNILFDENRTLYKRKGFSEWATLPATGTVLGAAEYTRSSGERWLIVQISSSLYSTKDDGATWATIKAGLSLINPCNFTTYLDELWITNGFDNVMTYNGSAITEYSFIPKGKYIITHFDQIFVANILGEPSSIRFSAVLLGPKVSGGWDNYNAFSIGKDDGDIITGLSSHRGNIVLFKTKSTWGILGYGDAMDLIKYSGIYGCVSHRSVQEYKNDLVFLSKQGLCAFNGGSIQQIDKQIDNETKNINIVKTSSFLRKKQFNDDISFGEGYTENTASRNNVLSLLRLSATTAESLPGATYLAGFYEYPIGVQQHSMVGYISLPVNTSTSPWRVSNIRVSLRRTDTVISSATIQCSLMSAENPDITYYSDARTLNLSSNFNQVAFFATSISTLSSGSFAVRISPMDGSRSWSYRVKSKIATGDIVWTFITVSVTGYDAMLAKEAEMRANGWAREADWGTIRLFPSGPVTYRSDWKKEQTTTSTVLVQLMCYADYEVFTSSFGNYISPAIDTTLWTAETKYFTASYTGSPIFSVRSATSAYNLDFATFTVIQSGDKITELSANKFLQWKAHLNNQNQYIYLVAIEEKQEQSVVSAVISNNRYIMAYSTMSTTSNNSILILDDNLSFSIFRPMASDIITQYDKNVLIISGVGKIYKLFDTDNDNSAAIDAYWTSKYLDFGLMDIDKSLSRIGVTAKGTGTLEVGYRSNYDTVFSTFPITLNSVTDNWVVNLPLMSPQKYWQVRVRNNAVGERFEIPRINLYFIPETLKSR